MDVNGAIKPNLSSYLSHQIQILIREKDLKPGDRLPSAKSLADQFSVATPTIREALRRLQATGMIDIKHGSGIYVRRQSDRLMLSNPGYGALEHKTILQVLDARMLIEPHLAGLTARKASEIDIDALKDLVARADGALETADDTYIRINFDFHAAIARMSGNLVLTHVVESLLEMYSTELHLTDPGSGFAVTRERDHHHHHQIIEAIAVRDEAAASAAMGEHIQVARSTVVAQVS
jgi:GntR family transcriptional repressor for pyruvate dehydrogenase complex